MKIAIILGNFSVKHRPIDFWYNNIFDNNRGLTGTDLAFVMAALTFAKNGHDVHLFTCHAKPHHKPDFWEGVKLYNFEERLTVVDETFDAILSINDPSDFIGMTEKPLRICWQFLNDFKYCAEGYDDYVDKWFGVCEQHTEYLKKLAPKPEKWGTIGLGCSPEWYKDERVPGRCIWTSSNDRGLHWLLSQWPKIKSAVPHASLRIFYHMNYGKIEEIEPNNTDELPLIVEMGQRIRYIKNALERLKDLDVEHIGSVSASQMIKEFNQASVFPFSCDTVSFSEGFSLSTLQALASFTVPVITSQDCLGSVYKDSGAIVIDTPVKDHLDQFTNEVIKALTDEQHANKIIDKCRIFAYQNTWEDIVKQLEDVIRQGKITNKSKQYYKLNLGSGISHPFALDIITQIDGYPSNYTGWESIDINETYPAEEHYDITAGVREKDNSMKEIWMGDFFEHLLREKAIFVINECYRVLEVGGRLRLSLPDMEKVMEKWLISNGTNPECSMLIWGAQAEGNEIPDTHKFGYTERSLTNLLQSVGFINIKRIGIHKNWPELALEAYK